MDLAEEKMNYSQVLEWIYSALPMFQKSGASAYKPGLDSTFRLMDYLGNPEKGLVCIHVAGTNGKGSVSNMLASILMESGYRTGLYTSPHLLDFRERIRVDGRMIPQQRVADFTNTHLDYFKANSLSFFEMSTGMAFDYFRSENVDVAVIETGLGGRLDSTNVVTPLLSIITNIALDHTAILGPTRPLIASEKAGIIKPGVPVLVGECDEEIEPVLRARADSLNAPFHISRPVTGYRDYGCPLGGDYQRFNISTVINACSLLVGALPGINDSSISSGLRNVVKNTEFHGRWQVLGEKPLVVCDTGHNVNGVSEVMRQLVALPVEKLHIVFGMVDDKDADGVLSLLPPDAMYYFVQASVRRALDSRILMEKAGRFSLRGEAFPDCVSGFRAALNAAGDDDCVFVGGSTFVVADILSDVMKG